MRKGFTLVEMLVVIAISAMLATVALIYTSTSRNQVALSVETSKVAQFLLRAKDLSIATYNNGASAKLTCAYGVYFNIALNTYSIFAYTPDPAKYGGSLIHCPSTAAVTAAGITIGTEVSEYDQSDWQVPVANGVKLVSGSAGDSTEVVIFYPPAPDTLVSRNGTTFLDPTLTSGVHLVTSDGSASATISINPAGQITF